MPSILAQVLFVLSFENPLVHCKLQYGENALSPFKLNLMHLVMFPWQYGAVLTERSAGCWEEKSPARCCGSAAPVGWRLHLTVWWSSTNRSGYSSKHTTNKWNPGCCCLWPCCLSWSCCNHISSSNLLGRGHAWGIWWLLLAASIKTKWHPDSRWCRGAATDHLHRTDWEDGKPKPEANWSQGCSAFKDPGCPEAHTYVYEMSRANHSQACNCAPS